MTDYPTGLSVFFCVNMGFFADQRIKNGTKAVRSEDRSALPKNRLNINVKPSTMGGDKGQDIPLKSNSSYKMTPDQQKKSKLQPK